MKSFYRGTTPLLRFDYPFEYADLTALTISFAQDGKTLLTIGMGDSEIDTIEDYGVSVLLTQTETNLFKHNFPVQTQVKLKTSDGEVWVGDIETYQVHRILDKNIM